MAGRGLTGVGPAPVSTTTNKEETLKAYFSMSEAQAEWAPDWESRTLEIQLGTEGAQLTYTDLRDATTGDSIAWYSEDVGCWIVDGVEYSDVVIV